MVKIFKLSAKLVSLSSNKTASEKGPKQKVKVMAIIQVHILTIVHEHIGLNF